MNRIPAAVIGLGQIGLGYDYDRARGDADVILTHAAALDLHPGFELTAAVDADPAKRARFEAKYGKPAYGDAGELRRRHAVEAWAVGVPTAFHHPVCEALLQTPPKAIVCEKPFTGRVDLAADLVGKAAGAGCLLAVNFNRRFIPSLEGLRREIRAGRFGTLYKGTLFYTKGIGHNGSHFLDLLGFLLGPSGGVHIVEAGRAVLEGDQEPDFAIRYGEATVHVLAGREECFYMGEFELVGTAGRIGFSDGEPIRTRIAEPNPLFAGENTLGAARALENPAARAIYHTWDALHAAITRGAPLASTGATALETLRTIEDIREQIAKGRT